MDRAHRELIRGYLDKAKAKLRVARNLLATSEWDDAVSRAYYAAFHAAQAVLLTEGQHGETHRGVVTLFGLFLVKTGKFERKWGKLLSDLKDDREAGDYDALSYIDEETARRAVREAKQFVSKVGAYLEKVIK